MEYQLVNADCLTTNVTSFKSPYYEKAVIGVAARSMLDTRMSSIFELMLDQASWTSSDTVGYSTLERPGAISVIFFLDDRPKIFDL